MSVIQAPKVVQRDEVSLDVNHHLLWGNSKAKYNFRRSSSKQSPQSALNYIAPFHPHVIQSQ